MELRTEATDTKGTRFRIEDAEHRVLSAVLVEDLGSARPQASAASCKQQAKGAAGRRAPRIFKGLQTSADPVYIVDDLGPPAACVESCTKASDETSKLEPDLLHPLASGPDVDRYAFLPLRQRLVFPYRRTQAGEMECSHGGNWSGFRAPRYLRQHEETLRAREGGSMDNDRWYAFGRRRAWACTISQSSALRHGETARGGR